MIEGEDYRARAKRLGLLSCDCCKQIIYKQALYNQAHTNLRGDSVCDYCYKNCQLCSKPSLEERLDDIESRIEDTEKRITKLEMER